MPAGAEGEGNKGAVVKERGRGRRKDGRVGGGGDGGEICIDKVGVEGAEEGVGEARGKGGAEVASTRVEARADKCSALIRSIDAERVGLVGCGMKEERVEQWNGAGGGGDSIGNKGVDEVVSANGGTQDTVTGESSAAVAAEHAVSTLEGGKGGIAKAVGDLYPRDPAKT